MKINLKKYLPLDSEESIHVLLHAIRVRRRIYNDEEIGEVLLHIRKVKYQLMFREWVDRFNMRVKKSEDRERKRRAKPKIQKDEEAEKRKMIRENNAKGAEKRRAAYLNRDSSSVYAISIPMGGKPKKY